MSGNPHKLAQFWQELKRRKVVRVITVYAAAAFVIIELTNNITGPLNLPDWISRWIIFLLAFGLLIAIVFSWIFDITPEGINRTKSVEENNVDHQATSSNSWKIATYMSLVIIIALIVFNIISINSRSRYITKSEKTLAVLPFQNLSKDSSQAYFCDGIMEEILNQLDRIDAFSLRSRTSSDQYKDSEKSSSIIGDELNVNYLVEGSVGLEGNEVKVWVQLIDAKSDEHIWSDDYVRQKVDVFTIQSEIAKNIAEELKVVLSSEELEKFEKMPTEKNEAYLAYRRGLYYINQPHFNPETWEHALLNFQQAIEIDPEFAVAYGELARTHARFYNLRYDLSDSRLAKADKAAAKALQLAPDDPAVNLAIGYYYLYGFGDLKAMNKHWEIAGRGLPNNVDLLIAKATSFGTQGRWGENIQILKKACELSPLDASVFTDLAMGLWLTRQYQDALDACNQAIMLNPDSPWPHIYKFNTLMNWKGPNKQSRDALNFVNKKSSFYLPFLYNQEIGERNFQVALDLMSDTSNIWGSNNKMWIIPKAMYLADIYDYLNDKKLSKKYYGIALEILQKEIKIDPENPSVHSSLGAAFAGIGQKEKAIEEGLLAVDLLPMSKDAFYGINYVHGLSIIYTMVGEYDLALDQIEYLLSVPSYLSVSALEWDIRFAQLTNLPRCKELISKYATKQ